jgi:peptide/nickel transport system permease protein
LAVGVRFLRGSTANIAVGGLALICVLAVLGPSLWRVDPLAIDLSAKLASPNLVHPMGTDAVGRDVLARFMFGAQISLFTGLASVLIGALIGGWIGIMAGSLGGLPDHVCGRFLDALLAFPPLMLAMAVTVGLGPGLASAAVGIILTSIPYYARVLRADVIRVRALSYTEASVAMGATSRWTIWRHIVPNVAANMPILAAANFGYAILTLAALSFVGLGAQIPTPEWGAMITDGQQFILTGHWWVGFFPGIGLLVVVSCANLLADRFRDVLDPRGEHALA